VTRSPIELFWTAKKENHQNLIPDMMGAFLDGPPHPTASKRQKPSAAAMESQFKISFLDFFEFSLHCNIALYIKSNIVLSKFREINIF